MKLIIREDLKKKSCFRDIVPNSKTPFPPLLEIGTLILKIKGRDTGFDDETPLQIRFGTAGLPGQTPTPPLGTQIELLSNLYFLR